MAGYARAVRVGNQVWVSGTTATDGAQLVGGDDPAAQARFVFQKIEKALNQLGAQMSDVVRTRVFVSDIRHWEAVARVHGEVFGNIRPANTLVQAQLVGEQYLVEIEADAVIAVQLPS
jgi:enamine deaminase RidA (YjgF/YER057c/UK114 family)